MKWNVTILLTLEVVFKLEKNNIKITKRKYAFENSDITL